MSPLVSEFSDDQMALVKEVLKLQHLELSLFKGIFTLNSSDSLEFKKLSQPLSGIVQSKSHTSTMAGVIRSKDVQCGVGFDIEKTERVTAEIAKRICGGTAEFSQAPSYASLWCAKEAAYKSLLHHGQPPTLMEITVGAWENHKGFETFRFLKDSAHSINENSGIVFQKTEFTYSFFAIRFK